MIVTFCYLDVGGVSVCVFSLFGMDLLISCAFWMWLSSLGWRFASSIFVRTAFVGRSSLNLDLF